MEKNKNLLIIKTTCIQKNGMTSLPKELREWIGNPSRIRWLEAIKEKDGVINIKIKVD